MTPDTIPQSVLFPDLFDKPLVATFNQEHASSDGGAVLLKAAERVYGLVKAFARCLADKRAPGKIRHTLADLIGQRVFGIACVIPMATMPTTWPTTPSTSCYSGGTRCPARPWRRNPRSRDSRTARAAPCSTGWGARWQRASSSVIGAA